MTNFNILTLSITLMFIVLLSSQFPLRALNPLMGDSVLSAYTHSLCMCVFIQSLTSIWGPTV